MKYRVTFKNKVYEVEVETVDYLEAAETVAAFPAAPVMQAAAPVAVTAPPVKVPEPVQAPQATASAGSETVLAPLPGTIFAVSVKPGDRVKRGELLLILEAMKMENEVLSPRDGTVAQVMAQKGAAVASGAPLLVLE
jgi:glutaconyl-CoA decarboxylase